MKSKKSPPELTQRVHIDDLSLKYPATDNRIISGVSLELNRGELVALMGSTGSGKSTLLRILSLGQDPTGSDAAVVVGGTAQVLGAQVRTAGRRDRAMAMRSVSYLPQNAASRLVPNDTVAEAVSSPLMNLERHTNTTSVGQRVATMIDAMDLPLSVLDKFPHELSGGQRQRVAIARAMILGPRLLLADEPTAGIDPAVKPLFSQMIASAMTKDFAAIVVTHDIDFIRNFGSRAIVLDRGIVIGDGRIDSVLALHGHPFLDGLREISKSEP